LVCIFNAAERRNKQKQNNQKLVKEKREKKNESIMVERSTAKLLESARM